MKSSGGLQNVRSEFNNFEPRTLNHHERVYRQTPCRQQIGDRRIEQYPLFAANPAAALSLLSMLGQAQLSIEDLLGALTGKSNFLATVGRWQRDETAVAVGPL